MRKIIATIETDIGRMEIYYNGAGEELTAEAGNLIEEICYTAASEEDAVQAVIQMYNCYVWDLNIIESTEE